MVTVKDIVWLAGLLEGEGSFYTYRKRNKLSITSYPELSVQSVDYDVIARVSRIIGNRISNVVPYNFGSKDSYKVRACSTKAAQWMMTIYSLMSIRRKEKIKEVLAAWKLTVDDRGNDSNSYYKKAKIKKNWKEKLVSKPLVNPFI